MNIEAPSLEILEELIDRGLRPDVVRIDVEGFYPREFLLAYGRAGGFAHHAHPPEGLMQAIEAMAMAGRVCGSTAFLIWCHDACVWYLANTANKELRDTWMEDVAAGVKIGATALSNPMKFFSGIEDLKLSGEPVDDGYVVSGILPWVSNLHPGHCFACVFKSEGAPVMALLECGMPGIELKPTARFAALEGTATYALRLERVFVPNERVIADPAKPFARVIRAGFILLQLGIGFGIIQGAIDDMQAADRTLRHINRLLPDRPAEISTHLAALKRSAERLAATPQDLDAEYLREVIQLRLETAELAFRATQSALIHAGAKGFILSSAPQRRLREAMFFSILTPSIKHLHKELSVRE